jgi:glutaminyl-tRNA synthetase
MEAQKELVEAPKEPVEAPKEISKRAAEKAKKKAEKAAKKAESKAESKSELASRPKKAAPAPEPQSTPTSVFEEGWLKKVYAEKPKTVRTRFPPEPNGFLHIGHAKAIAVNFGFAKFHKGICFLRFDDTNPEKEEAKFFQSIEEIIKWLGFEPYQITYSSDHFDQLYDLAEELIKKDKAYVCHCTKEEVNLQRGGPDNRGPRFACKHRNRPIDESITEFRAMKDGKYKAGEAHLRMKQKIDDPNEGNPQMWDLAAYRVLEKNWHPRTHDKWKIYPTYDFTHCLCDAFEEISHSMCTTEFYLSRTSYDWLLEELEFKLPHTEEKGPMQRE